MIKSEVTLTSWRVADRTPTGRKTLLKEVKVKLFFITQMTNALATQDSTTSNGT